jgi:hypothetical protein
MLRDPKKNREKILENVNAIFNYYTENHINKYRYDQMRRSSIANREIVENMRKENNKLKGIFRILKIDYEGKLNERFNKS